MNARLKINFYLFVHRRVQYVTPWSIINISLKVSANVFIELSERFKQASRKYKLKFLSVFHADLKNVHSLHIQVLYAKPQKFTNTSYHRFKKSIMSTLSIQIQILHTNMWSEENKKLIQFPCLKQSK